MERRDTFAFTGLVAGARSIAVHDVLFHQTDDPDVAIVEERMVAELADGDTYENRFIIRVTFRDRHRRRSHLSLVSSSSCQSP
ncbi:hypothetical protein [Nonomuraea sp. 10N515B]|uniref:hypothetical protein n=1 Tax=Nonomuraea sp. 10N515B TaxID=3457422 RepID=UPI003FCCC72B